MKKKSVHVPGKIVTGNCFVILVFQLKVKLYRTYFISVIVIRN